MQTFSSQPVDLLGDHDFPVCHLSNQSVSGSETHFGLLLRPVNHGESVC